MKSFQIEIPDLCGSSIAIENMQSEIRILSDTYGGKPSWLDIDHAKQLRDALDSVINSAESWVS